MVKPRTLCRRQSVGASGIDAWRQRRCLRGWELLGLPPGCKSPE